MTISLTNLQHYKVEGNHFLSLIVTCDEMWVDHYRPETKMKSMVWKHFTSPAKEKFMTSVSKGKVMAIAVKDIQKTILGDFTPNGVMMSKVVYQVSLQCIKEVI
jgi:hypothetical protein